MSDAILNEKKAMECMQKRLFNNVNLDIFYYRVVNNLRISISLEILKKDLSFKKIIIDMKKIYEYDIFNETLKRVKLKYYNNITDKIKVLLLKKKLILIYVILKKI